MLLAGIQKHFLDTGLKPAGMTSGNSDTQCCGAVLRKTNTEDAGKKETGKHGAFLFLGLDSKVRISI